MKAALLSGLVFPGVGHFVLGKHVRGIILCIGSLFALEIIIENYVRKMWRIVEAAQRGAPLDLHAITELIMSNPDGAGAQSLNIAVIVLSVCWMAAVVDSYRLGRARDRMEERRGVS